MKKYLIILAICVLALGLAACGTDAPADGDANAVNPLIEATAEDIQTTLGIDMALPEGAEDVVYTIIDTEPADIAQADFIWQGHAVTYRICAAVEYADISGLYYDWANALEWQVGTCPGRVCYNAEGPGYCGWYDAAPGLLYNVAVTEGATSELLTDLASMLYVPVQGNA